jgi:hypothetical protein
LRGSGAKRNRDSSSKRPKRSGRESSRTRMTMRKVRMMREKNEWENGEGENYERDSETQSGRDIQEHKH